jgi:hypothetical protein
MTLRSKTLIAVLSITALPALFAAEPPFRPGNAADYPSCQTVGKLKLAAVKYESDDETHPVFAKTNPNEYGVLPILLILDNQGDDTLMLDRMQVRYQIPGQPALEPVEARELPFVIGPKRPNTGMTYPSPIPLPKKKNPLAKVEFQTRAWGAKNLLKGENAHGFFYFQVRHNRNAVLYITGIREAGTGKELFYAEVPLDTPKAP